MTGRQRRRLVPPPAQGKHRQLSRPQALGRAVDTNRVRKVVLEYPNGRRHEIEFESDQRLEIGDQFELYGRRWRVISTTIPRKPGTRRYVESNAIVCRPITASPLTGAGPTSDPARG